MRGKLKDLTFGRNGEQHITITVTGDFREEFDRLKDRDVNLEIKRWREPRSKDANAYFHVLVNKIAEAQNLGDEEVKRYLVSEYGSLARDYECYLFYKRSYELDSKEMARLIDGAIFEARNLGIDTDPPEMIARYKEEWNYGINDTNSTKNDPTHA